MKKLAHWAPAPNLTILTVERDETNWGVSLSGGDHAICPVCRVRSHSRHSSYRRTLRDLPAQGTPVEVRAQMTRWRCRNDRCERRIFAARIPGLAAPFARRTTRLAGIVRLFGHSAGGRPSERLVEPALNCFARGCYRFRNTTCTESETDPLRIRNDGEPGIAQDGLSQAFSPAAPSCAARGRDRGF